MLKTETKAEQYAKEFQKYRYLKFANFFGNEVFTSLRNESLALLDKHSRRKDFIMEETDSTARKISTVSGNVIDKESALIVQYYRDPGIISLLEKVADTKLFVTPDVADRHAIHRLHKKGDEHGGHVDTYPYVLITCLEHPDSDGGGELEFVPNSTNINELKTNKVIRDTLRPGESYFMHASINVHCVKPLKKNSNRTVLVFTYADESSRDIEISYSSNKLYD